MIVHVDPGDPTPVYEQLRAQVARMAAAGTLAPGTQLPTIRQLASDLGLSKGTVAKAYEALLRDGVVASAGRRGTVVREPASNPDGDVAATVRRAAEALVVVARQLGLDRDAAHAAVDAAYDDLGA